MKRHLNLLPLSLLRRQLLFAALRRWSIAWGLVGIAAGLACALYHRQTVTLEHEAAGLQRQSESLRRLKSEADRMCRELNNLESRESLLAASQAAPSPFQLLGIASGCTAGGQQGVSVNQLELVTQKQRRATTAEPAADRDQQESAETTQPQEIFVLRLRGNAIDDLAIANFVKSLREAVVFTGVQLKSTKTVELLSSSAREFEIECYL